MFKEIIRQWKKHFWGTTLLLVGYLIGILFLSLGVSIAQESRENALISTSGDPNNSYVISVDTFEDSVLTFDNITPILDKISTNVEVQVLNLDNIKLKENLDVKPSLVPLIYHQKPEWLPPILYGRYFTSDETLGDNHIAIIGKELYNRLCSNGLTKNSSITIDDTIYNVIGVIGKENRLTQFDYTIYVPLRAIPNDIKSTIGHQDTKLNNSNVQIPVSNDSESLDQIAPKQIYSLTMFLRKNGNTPNDDVENLKIELGKINPKASINYSKVILPEGNTEQFRNSVILTIIISGAILLVTIINVMNLSIFWILDRRREIVIKKVLGAVDKLIIKPILIESIFIAILACLIAILLHFSIIILAKSKLVGLEIALNISWLNLIVAFSVSIFCGIATSIPSIRMALNMNPVEILKSE